MAKRALKRHLTFKTILKVTLIVIVSMVGLGALGSLVSYIGFNASMKLAKSLAKVEKTEVLEPIVDEGTGVVTFRTDRDFKVLQLTDTHIGAGFASIKKDAWAINAIAEMVSYTKPDLVIVTGDMVYPVPFQSGTINNLNATKLFAATMESLGVYWTVSFGNHDTEVYSLYNREKISDYYEKTDFDYCVYTAGPKEIDGYGNQVIAVENSGGIVTQALVIFDSHAYTKGFYQEYDNIHENQVVWYKNEIERLSALNASRGVTGVVKSLAFFHIPLVEMKTAWFEYIDNGFKSTADVKYFYGQAGESGKVVYSGTGEDNLFETMIALESTQGVFVGHDHLNNFSISYNGGAGDYYIRLTASLSIDYLAYPGIHKQVAQRGGTVITTATDGSFDCYGLRLYDKGILYQID